MPIAPTAEYLIDDVIERHIQDIDVDGWGLVSVLRCDGVETEYRFFWRRDLPMITR